MEFISLAIKKQKHMGLQKKECSNTPIHPLMTSSDFLVLITILLAIVSTAIANNKMIWIYKFSRFSIITYILIMIAINYFIFFPWYEQRGIYIERLMIKGSPMAATWGYILSLVFIFLLIWKIAIYRHFPSSNKAKLISYYKSLINSNINVLTEYLQTYHLEEIEKLITKINKSYNEQNNALQEESPWNDEQPTKNKLQKKNTPIETAIFNEVILNKTFVIKSVEHDSTFFLKCVHRCINANIVGFKNVVEVYFRTMIRQKNSHLLEGLKGPLNYKGNQDIEYRLDDSPFLTLLFTKTEFVYNLEVFRAFGEEAFRESSLGNSIFSEQTNEWRDNKYQSTAVFQFLRFTDIFIRRLLLSIKKDNKPQDPYLNLYYFKMICSNLIENHTIHYANSYAEKYVNDVVHNINTRIHVMEKLRINIFEVRLLKIYAQLAEELAETPRLENFGIEMASRFLTDFLSIEQREAIHIQKLQKNEQTSLITNVYIDFIKKIAENKKDIYKKAWRKVDKIKYPNSLFMTELSDLLGEEQE